MTGPAVTISIDDASDTNKRIVEALRANTVLLEQLLAALGTEKSSPDVGKLPEAIEPDPVTSPTTNGSQDKAAPVEPPEHDSEEDEPRYAIVLSKYDHDVGDYKDDTQKPEKKKIGPQNKSKRAFMFRKYTMARSRHSRVEAIQSEVIIDFEPLQKLLGSLTMKWGWSENVVSCVAPYWPLIYSWDEAKIEAEKHVEGEPDDEAQAREDLRELMRMISTSSGYTPLDEYFKHRETFIEERTITHAALWTLFPPGTLVISRPFLDEAQVFTVSSSDKFVGETHTFDMVCFSFDWDGVAFRRVPFEMKIPYWGPDRRSIVELPFYPLQYYTEPDSDTGESSEDAISRLKQKLITRGRKFREYCLAEKGKQMFKYEGVAHFNTSRSLLQRSSDRENEINDRDDDSSITTRVGRSSGRTEVRQLSKKKIEGTVMVDFDSFYEYLSADTPILGNLPRYQDQLESLSPEKRASPVFKDMYKFEWDTHVPEDAFDEDQLLHCPPRVLGYALKQKKWSQLLVEKLKSPDAADASVFEDKLQLEPDSKDLVKWSVQAHEKGKTTNNKGEPLGLQDFAPDKGKGLVIMLYGFPGVGKTLTAESVALMAGKPLLSVGVSDIGIEGDKVEANLQKVFDLAGKWEAVLLFDEADVFLEARGEGENDLRRNAMVSVLLRVLEYYDGILILTTNRMRSFDIAVQSRIHIAIKYEELSPEQQIKIFDFFLQQLDEKKLVHDVEDLMEWVRKDSKKMKFNGRQIRNVVSTAMGIALVDKKANFKMRREHIVKVAAQTNEFKNDLKSQEEIYKKATR